MRWLQRWLARRQLNALARRLQGLYALHAVCAPEHETTVAQHIFAAQIEFDELEAWLKELP